MLLLQGILLLVIFVYLLTLAEIFFMNNQEVSRFFECLGEIWRDITAIEFLMRCAITKKDGDDNKFPAPPYIKGKIYKTYPKAFEHYSFEIVVAKFNKRYPNTQIPAEVVALRDAMAHGVTTEINNDGLTRLIKFKECKDCKELKVEFSLDLESTRIAQIRQSLGELRRDLMREIDESLR